MAFSLDIDKPELRKQALVVITPRVRATGWTLSSANVYSTPFTKGRVVAVWSYDKKTGVGFTEGAGPTGLAFNAFGTSGEFYHDGEVLYVGTPVDPDTNSGNIPLAGYTVEFEVYVSSTPQFGISNPLDVASEHVEWQGKLESIPSPKFGSTDDIFGYQPLNIDSISIINDGWMYPLQYDVSWNQAPVKVYLMIGETIAEAFANANIRQIFLGFTTDIAEANGIVTIGCADHLSILDSAFNTYSELGFSIKYSSSLYPNIQPEAVVPGKEWFVRSIYGQVDEVEPVNLDYSATPSTTNNRRWATHTNDSVGLGDLSQIVDHTAANTGTQTYFTTTPNFGVGDHIRLTHNLSFYYTIVLTVDRAAKFITHVPIPGRTIVSGDTADRFFAGNVYVVDRDGSRFPLYPGRDYTMFTTYGSLSLDGFLLNNNFESFALAHVPFDPARDKITCRVYGPNILETYADATDVLSLSPATGNDARAGALIYRLLVQAGIEKELIDKTSFEQFGADTHAMGFIAPIGVDDAKMPTYKEIMAEILQSGLLKVSLLNDATSGIYVGLYAVGPFATSGDFEITDAEYSQVEWAHDYNEIYSEVLAEYRVGNAGNTPELLKNYVFVENLTAKYVHNASKRYDIQLKQMDDAEAQEAANRLAFVLSDRRMLYTLKLPQGFITKAAIGVAFLTNRNRLPGFDFDYNTQNQRTLGVVEVQKNIDNVLVTLDDQKAIQDNSGDW
jgi:hypothetical protein